MYFQWEVFRGAPRFLTGCAALRGRPQGACGPGGGGRLQAAVPLSVRAWVPGAPKTWCSGQVFVLETVCSAHWGLLAAPTKCDFALLRNPRGLTGAKVLEKPLRY